MTGKLKEEDVRDHDHQEDREVHHHEDPDHEVDQDQVVKILEAVQDRDPVLLKRNLDDHEAAQDQTLDEFDEKYNYSLKSNFTILSFFLIWPARFIAPFLYAD